MDASIDAYQSLFIYLSTRLALKADAASLFLERRHVVVLFICHTSENVASTSNEDTPHSLLKFFLMEADRTFVAVSNAAQVPMTNDSLISTLESRLWNI